MRHEAAERRQRIVHRVDRAGAGAGGRGGEQRVERLRRSEPPCLRYCPAEGSTPSAVTPRVAGALRPIDDADADDEQDAPW